jgi:integrase
MSAIENWVSRLSPNTAKLNRYFLGRWVTWMGENGGKFSAMSPDELVAYQRAADNGARYDILDLVQKYSQDLPGRFGSKNKIYTTIRSFFAHNRAELPRDSGFTLRSDVPNVVGALTAENLRDLVLSGKPVYRAVILSMFQGGLDLEGFAYWNSGGWEKLRKDLKDDPETIRIDLPGRKRFKNRATFFTFIGDDAIKAIRDYLPLRPRNATAIFTDQFGGPIRKGSLRAYWDAHLRKIGLVSLGKGKSSNRYGLNIHEMRDLFRTLWAKSGASPEVAEFCLQHQIDALGYNKIFNDEAYMREQYRKALPHLQIMSGVRAFNLADEDEVAMLKKEIAELKTGRDEEKAENDRVFREMMEDMVRDKFAELEELRAKVKALEANGRADESQPQKNKL